MSKLIASLEALGVLHRERLEVYHPTVRDRDDIAVLRDKLTEVIVLSRSDHVLEHYYEERKETEHYQVQGAEVATPRLEDNIRRRLVFGSYIRNKHWLDFGCGRGGMLDEMASEAASATGLEPNAERAALVMAKGHTVVRRMEDLPAHSFDVVTLFHVLEHLPDPVETLSQVRRLLKPGGRLLVEVPHARDALFTLYESEAFRRFTFWSEHLVLHTRLSLRALLERAGFPVTEVTGYQRYPLANHLHWLAKQKPGGHEIWRFLVSTGLDDEYASALAGIDRTDTLIAFA